MSIYMAGDSTAAYKLKTKRPETGWFEMLPEFIAPGTDLRNFALNGRSTKSFIDQGHLMTIEAQIRTGDLLLVQFSHNDEKDDPVRHTDPDTTFTANLLEFIRVAREAGAQPVLLTPVVRRSFDPAGKLVDTHGSYPDAIRRLAAKEALPLVDVTASMAVLVGSAGLAGSKHLYLQLDPGVNPNYPDGVADDTHLSPDGARAVAAIVAEKLRFYSGARWL
jgi:lysophospholipase L1-like esterase